ncbi:MAG: hypothetical protein JSW07_20200, partial [bacterium]
MAKIDKFRFRKHDNIGAADAEGDKFLHECFVDTGDIEVLRDCADCRSIVVGRTGSGKTALLQRLIEVEERAIEVSPEGLSLSYVSNSTIITYLSDLGVNLDVFYKLLWRHVFAVELIKENFGIHNETDLSSFWSRIASIFRNKKEQNAINYLRKWGENFWEESEYRIKEITNELERKIKGSLNAKYLGKGLSVEGSRKLTGQEKIDVRQRAQSVINNVQVRQLADIIDLLDEVLDDPQKKYFIVVDSLDEDWVDDKVRYKLIHALIQCVRDFRKVRHAKIIVAIRLDLLERVFRLVSVSGYQEEKYRALYVPLNWTKKNLLEVLDRRIDFLVRQRYTKQKVTHRDLLPKTVRNESAPDFIIKRTLMYPRDVILFFNQCILRSEGQPVLRSKIILAAEGEYSRLRFKALADEWSADYPLLSEFVSILKKRKHTFPITKIPDAEIGEFCLDQRIANPTSQDSLSMLAKLVAEDVVLTPREFIKKLFLLFYKIGLVALKVESYDKFISVDSSDRT